MVSERVCKILDDVGGEFAHGYTYNGHPVSAAVALENLRIMQEETFGPVIPIASFSSVEEAIALANDSIFGLSAAVFSADHGAAIAVAERLQVEGYPSVLLIHQGQAYPIPVRHQGADVMLGDISDLLAEPQA